MTSSAQDSRPVVRLSTPADMVGLVPHLVGFVPRESLVALSLKGRRARVGLTIRVDLPAPEHEDELVDQVADRLAADGAGRVLAVLYTGALGGGLPLRSLVERLQRACEQRGAGVDDVLLVRDGRWYSYLCRSPRCCPADGTVLEVEPSPSLTVVAAHAALDGRAVLASRDALTASVAPPVLLARRVAADALDVAARARTEDVRARGLQATSAAGLASVAVALRRYACPPAQLEPGQAATLAVALLDVHVRDEVATWGLDEPDALLRLLTDVARSTVAPYDPPVCTLLAWTAYGRGDGALANVALDRALTSDPAYALAGLLRQALDAQVPPAEVRALLAATRDELRLHPGSGPAAQRG